MPIGLFCAQVKKKSNVPPVDEKWVEQIAALPAKRQAEEVILKIKDLNQLADPYLTYKVEDDKVTEVGAEMRLHCRHQRPTGVAEFAKTQCSTMPGGSGKLKDLAVLKYLKELTHLACLNSYAVRDLKPLKGLPLVEIRLICGKITTLEPLAGNKTLVKLDIASATSIVSLKPLEDCNKLEFLNLASSLVSDLEPLRGKPLKEFLLTTTKALNLEPLAALKGKPLKELRLNAASIPSLAPLAGMPLELLALHTKGMLQQISAHSSRCP